MTSGGSVIGIKFNGGAILASDTLLSYGSLAKIPNVPRIKIIGKHTAICAQGDYADFQNVVSELERDEMDCRIEDDYVRTPEEIFSVLHREVYQRRTDFDPALCTFLVVGSANGRTLLGGVDDIGTRWTSDCVAAGYGAHIALPLLRKALEVRNGNLTRDEAIAVVQDALRVLFYRECRTMNKFQIAIAENDKVIVSPPFSVDTKWDYDGFAFEKTAIIR